MMSIPSFIPATDNFYKFLFVGGIFMVAFAFIYPMEKRQALELEKIELERKDTLLDIKLSRLKAAFSEYGSQKIRHQKTSKSKNKYSSADPDSIRMSNDNTSRSLDSAFLEFQRDQIDQYFYIETYNVLADHIRSFHLFECSFKILGFIIMVLGGFKWWQLTQKLERST